MEIPTPLYDARNEIEKQFLDASTKPGPVALAHSVARGKAPGKENIVGVGIGKKYTAGVSTGELCVKVYVVQKLPKKDVSIAIPETIGDFKTDVIELGTVVAYQLTRRFRPAPGGVSIGHHQVTAGTLGTLVTCGKEVYILSNNHVIANSNKGRKGDVIVQPATADGGVVGTDDLAVLHDFVHIDFTSSGRNDADAALARPNGNWHEKVVPFVLRLGEVRGVREPLVDLEVQKMGRTTRLTRGGVEDVSVTITVGYEGGQSATFYDQVSISGLPLGAVFSLPGDSGSLVLDENGLACALLFAGSQDARTTFATPINRVLKELRTLAGLGQVDLWTFPW